METHLGKSKLPRMLNALSDTLLHHLFMRQKLEFRDGIVNFLPLSHDRSFIVALVVPSKIHLESMAHKKLSKVTGSWSDLCEDQEVEAEVLKQLTDHAKKSKQVS